MKAWWSKLRAYVTGRKHLADELQEEMDAHLQFEVEDCRDQGMTTDEARAAASRRFGNSTLIAEKTRDAWEWAWIEQVRQDIAYAVRVLWRSPGFTISAVSILALGIGANLAIFHILNAALFHRLSVRDADSIIAFERSGRFPYKMVEFLRENNTVFAYILAQKTDSSVLFGDDTEPDRATFVSGNFFADLGVNPGLGRMLDQRDAAPDAPVVVVLSHRFWQRRFDGDPQIIGQAIRLNGKPVQVVGVAPQDFTGLNSEPASTQPAFWLPLEVHPLLFPGSEAMSGYRYRDTDMYAKLKPSVPLDAANAQVASLTSELLKQHPELPVKPGEAATGRALLYTPLDALVPIILVTLLFLLVLITACANLGNLLLARGHARQREISIRVALGAGAWRIVRQLMVENTLLAMLGSAAGLAVGLFAAKGLLYLMQAPPDLQLLTDWRIVLASATLAVFSAIVFGLAPARQAVGLGSSATRTRRVLVAVQVAASCFLLVLAGQVARSVDRQLTLDVRYDYRRMFVVDPQLGTYGLPAPAARQKFGEMSARLARLPGVTGVALTLSPPLGGRLTVDSSYGRRIAYNQVDPSYFELMSLPVVRGRLFSSEEPDAAVLSESAARAVFPDQDPIGQTIQILRFNLDGMAPGKVKVNGKEQRVVIGVVKDASTSTNIAEGYFPIKDADLPKAVLLVHTLGDPAGILKDARSAASLPGLASSASLVRSGLDRDRGKQRGAAQGVASLGGAATLLAAVGIFGLMSFAVAQRTREIGVRMALGARPSDILGTLLNQYAVAVGIGAAAGVVLAGLAGRVLQSQIIGVGSLDLASYATALAVFSAAALAAVFIPIQRALRIDPASALRWE